MTRQVRLTVSEHPVAGSSLRVLHEALLREVVRNARRLAVARSKVGRTRARNDLDAAKLLAREAGCDERSITRAGRGVR